MEQSLIVEDILLISNSFNILQHNNNFNSQNKAIHVGMLEIFVGSQ
jgi:hypothetical protein